MSESLLVMGLAAMHILHAGFVSSRMAERCCSESSLPSGGTDEVPWLSFL
jgi:hypothetical protein